MRYKCLSIVALTIIISLVSNASAQQDERQYLTRDSYKNAVRIALPSVVSIRVRLILPYSPVEGKESPLGGGGSGVIIDREGYILTNKHVIDGSVRTIRVTLSDGQEFPATLKGKSSDTDLALIKIENMPQDIRVAEFRDFSTVEPGEIVVAIGSPFGLRETVTKGIVSAIRVDMVNPETNTPIHAMVQTDAAINSGNSGGPLLDLDGKVIGINTFILSRTGGSVGLGFAIPANVAQIVYKELKGEKKTQGWIGVQTQKATRDLIRVFGLPADASCLVVTAIVPDGPAQKAGLKQGDCISIKTTDDLTQTDPMSFEWSIRDYSIDSVISLTVVSRAGIRTVRIVVEEKPEQ